MGGKIALVKSKEQWTTDLAHLLQSFQSQTRAKECSNGLKYQDYLKQILFLQRMEHYPPHAQCNGAGLDSE